MTRLFVICGHGAGDPGACGNGYQEAERVRVLGKRIKELGGDDVMLGDVNRNYYADNGISALDIPKDYQIIEFHMDSAVETARGAHVIIKAGLEPDQYDKALAKYLSELLPGRSQTIVGRDDLANPDRAYVAGYGYRLAEVGFISNAQDVAIFNANIDNIAKGTLACFGIGANSTLNPAPAPKPQPTPVPKPSTPTCKYDLGTPVCTNRIWSSSTDTGVGFSGDWQANITRIVPGARHPYLIGDGIGWTDDVSIDSDSHTPGKASTSSKPVSKPKPSTTIKVGDWVGVHVGAKDYNGGGLASFVYNTTYSVIEINGNRVVIGQNGVITAAVHKDNLYKV